MSNRMPPPPPSSSQAPTPRPRSSAGRGDDRWYRRRLRRRVLGFLACVLGAIVLGRLAIATAWGQSADTLFMEALIRWADRVGGLPGVITSIVSAPAMVLVGALVFVVAVARRRPTLAGRAIVVVVGANATTQIVKALVHRPDLGVTTALANSLPSGHTTVAMSVSLALVMVAPRWLRGPAAWAGWAWTSLMGISVMMSAWHRLADVVVAVLVCGAWALALSPIEGRERHAPGVRRAMAIAVWTLCGIALALSLIALVGVDVAKVATPGSSGYGFSVFLESAPWRARLLAVAAGCWVIGVVGAVLHEVDALCVDRR